MEMGSPQPPLPVQYPDNGILYRCSAMILAAHYDTT